MASLSDKNAIMQVIGSLMKTPVILADGKYILTINDFDLPLARNILRQFQTYSKITNWRRLLSLISIIFYNKLKEHMKALKNKTDYNI